MDYFLFHGKLSPLFILFCYCREFRFRTGVSETCLPDFVINAIGKNSYVVLASLLWPDHILSLNLKLLTPSMISL